VKVSRGVRGAFIVAFFRGAVYLWRSGAVAPSSVKVWLESLGPVASLIAVAAFIAGAFVGLPGWRS
jgi:hypothetical protein